MNVFFFFNYILWQPNILPFNKLILIIKAFKKSPFYKKCRKRNSFTNVLFFTIMTTTRGLTDHLDYSRHAPLAQSVIKIWDSGLQSHWGQTFNILFLVWTPFYFTYFLFYCFFLFIYLIFLFFFFLLGQCSLTVGN